MALASLTTINAMRSVAAQYDFAIHGGAVGAILLRLKVPSGAIVTNAVLEVLTAPTGSGATIAVSLESANDIVSAAAISGAPWSTTGIKLGVPDFATVGDQFKTTAERELTVTVGTAALTAGKFNVFLQYLINSAA